MRCRECYWLEPPEGAIVRLALRTDCSQWQLAWQASFERCAGDIWPAAERSLLADGQDDFVLETQPRVQKTMRDDYVFAVEQLTRARCSRSVVQPPRAAHRHRQPGSASCPIRVAP